MLTRVTQPAKTKLKGFDNTVTFIPNQVLSTLPITNLSRSKNAIFSMQLDLALGLEAAVLDRLRNTISHYIIKSSTVWKPSITFLLGVGVEVFRPDDSLC
jgi:small-conductance mechanosensitive channel